MREAPRAMPVLRASRMSPRLRRRPDTSPKVTETTAMGACYLAGLAVGYWGSLDEIKRQWQADRTFRPSGADVTTVKEGWKDAISRTINH